MVNDAAKGESKVRKDCQKGGTLTVIGMPARARTDLFPDVGLHADRETKRQ